MCNLKEFLYSILRHWKVLVFVSVISALIGSGYYYFSYKQNVGTVAEDSTENFDETSTTEDWSQLDNIYVGQLKFIGVGNEKITSDVIRDAYFAELLGTEFVTYMQENYFEHHSLKYVREVVVPSSGNLSNFLGVDIYCVDEETCDSVLKGIVQYVNEKSAELSKHVGEHELHLLTDAIEEAKAQDHSEKIDTIQSIVSQEGIAQDAHTFSLKRMAIYAILCLVFVDACACLVFILKDSFGDCIYNSRMLAEATNSELLGDFSGLQIKGKIDRKLYEFLIAGKYLSEAGIANFVNYKLTNKYAKEYNYLLVGNISREMLEEKANVLTAASDTGVTFSVIELIDENIQGLEKINKKQALIYVVQRFVDNKKEAIQNLDIYKELGIEIAGILFV